MPRLCLCHLSGILQLSLGEATHWLWLWLPSLRRGGRRPSGQAGVRRVRCLLEGFQDKMLSSLWRPVLLAVSSSRPPGPALPARLGYTRQLWPASLGERQAASEGGLQPDREFQPLCYLRIGQLMVSAEHFSIGEANTI